MPFAAPTNSAEYVQRVLYRVRSPMGIPLESCHGKEPSDCVFLLRPSELQPRERLMLAFRALYGAPMMTRVLEKGAGAAYISKSVLSNAMVPIGASAVLEYADKYAMFVNDMNADGMGAIEEIVRRSILDATSA